jgi:tryptophan synthase beta subunit
MQDSSTQVGSYVAISGMVVSILAHYNIFIEQNSIVAVIAGAVALYGIIHQFIKTKQVTVKAIEAGVKGIK